MNVNNRWVARVALAAAAVIALGACSEGGMGAKPPGPAAGPMVDAFTSTVATMARHTPDDTMPADIDTIPVVLVEDQVAVTVN